QRLDVVAEGICTVALLEPVQDRQQALPSFAIRRFLDGQSKLGDQPFMSVVSHASLPRSPPLAPVPARPGTPAPARSSGDDVGSGRAASMPPGAPATCSRHWFPSRSPERPRPA